MSATDKLSSRKGSAGAVTVGGTLTLHLAGQAIPLGEAQITLPSLVADLAGLSPAEQRALEWSDLEPCISGTGGWLSCPCCGAVKIDGQGHAEGCAVAAAIVASSGVEDAVAEERSPGDPVWVVRFPDGGTEEFRGLGNDTGEWSARLRQRQWRATVGLNVETGAHS